MGLSDPGLYFLPSHLCLKIPWVRSTLFQEITVMVITGRGAEDAFPLAPHFNWGRGGNRDKIEHLTQSRGGGYY